MKSLRSPALSQVKLERIKEARKILELNQIDWTERTSATHFILHLTDLVKEDVSFWPTTGRFYSKAHNYKGRGLNNLIKFINKYYPISKES